MMFKGLSNTYSLLSAIKYEIRYTRQLLKSHDIDKQQIKKQETQSRNEKIKTALYELKSNEKNPSNHIKVRINHLTLLDPPKKNALTTTPKLPYILTPEPKPPRIFISAIRKYILTSTKKSKIAMFNIRKLHLFDAINELENSDKKVAKLMIPTLYNLVHHAKDKGLDTLRLYIHGVLIGKTRRFKGIRYHAKGKSGREKTDQCQIKIVLYEKDQKSFYEDLALGKCPGALASLIRQQLTINKVGLKQIIQYSGITTSRGRQQTRQLFKRKVYMKIRDNNSAGSFVPRKVIEKEIKSQLSEKMKQLIQKLYHDNNVRKRELMFKKNMA